MDRHLNIRRQYYAWCFLELGQRQNLLRMPKLPALVLFLTECNIKEEAVTSIRDIGHYDDSAMMCLRENCRQEMRADSGWMAAKPEGSTSVGTVTLSEFCLEGQPYNGSTINYVQVQCSAPKNARGTSVQVQDSL